MSERDWVEDFPQENGNYTNKCAVCGELFSGHKRRVTCRECATRPVEQQRRTAMQVGHNRFNTGVRAECCWPAPGEETP